MSRTSYSADKRAYSYDYENQAWIVDGKYTDCGHPAEMTCNCYGRKHKGEIAIITADCQ